MRKRGKGRKPKTQRVPRTRAGGEWTEAGMWGFFRSNLRNMSRRWPPLVRLVFNKVRRPYKGPNKRQKWEYQCADCGQWFPRKKVQADHIVPCGPLTNWDEFKTFAERLFVETDGLAVRCETCHQIRTRKNR